MFRLMKALDFTEVETAEFWVEIETAYAKDRALQMGAGKPADNFPFQEFAYVGEFSVDAS